MLAMPAIGIEQQQVQWACANAQWKDMIGVRERESRCCKVFTLPKKSNSS